MFLLMKPIEKAILASDLGITPGTAGTLDPAAFGLEPRPITTDPGWPADSVSPETQQTDPSQPGPDDIVNG